MRGTHFDRILAGTALALVLALGGPAAAATDTPRAIEAAIPVPEAANVPPPSAADIAATAPTVRPGSMPASTASVPAPAASAPAPTAPAVSAPAPVPVAPTVAATLNPADAALAEKLQELLAGKGDRLLARRADKAGIDAFYRARNYAPLWVGNGAPSARATQAIAFLRGVGDDGLEPAEYPAPDFKSQEPDALAEAELRYTSTVLTFVRHAEVGRVHWSRVSGDIHYPQDATEAGAVLESIARAKTAGEALAGYLPQHPLYQALKTRLAEVRKQTETNEEVVRIPEGPSLKAGQSDPRVTFVRKRLKIEGDLSNPLYDESVVAAVKAFQKSAGLNGDGSLGPATLRALNAVQKRERTEDIILANLERWRWMPHNLGKTHVILNIPEFRLRLIRDEKLYWTTKVVVGKPSQPTPITSATMKFITVNPTWNVPPSIIANEYLPALRQDPGALERIGLKVQQNPDGTVRIYQPPGDRNALGRIRFNFPNKFLVYQHDTPDKHLFAQDKRAYSHGCMRVENPLMYGEKLLSIVRPNDGYTAARLQGMFGGAEINIDFPMHLPVHLTYQTAFVDEDGKLQIRDDVYGRDARLIAILKGDERKVAEVPVERSHTGSGVSKDALKYNVPGGGGEFTNPFASWFAPRQEVRPPQRVGNGRNGSRVSTAREPSFLERMFR
jgi:murein L,D-transpeptidase YcbB/YkuD